jgi:FAD/FMN-containing dehydrogenase
MLTNQTTGLDLRALRATLPDGEALAAAEAPSGLRPAAVVVARSVADVQATVRYARGRGVGVVPHATGHGTAALGSLQDSILLRTGELSGVRIHPETRTARVAAGATWGELAICAGEHGLAGLAGTHESVGVVGYTLGGGLGRLGRRYGLAAGGVRAIELVTADGRVVRADASQHPELLWALRGGGIAVGVVTALELELHPVRDVHAGALVWTADRAREVLRTWRTWADHVPRELSSTATLCTLADDAAVPERLRGRRVVSLEVTHAGRPQDAGALLEPLRALAPALDTVRTLPACALGRLHGPELRPAAPPAGPVTGDNALLRGLPDEALDTLIAGAGWLQTVELRHLGGALAEDAGGALGGLEGRFLLHAFGHELALGALVGALAAWDSGRRYLNFAHRPANLDTVLAPGVRARLAQVKAAYDPHGVFRARG